MVVPTVKNLRSIFTIFPDQYWAQILHTLIPSWFFNHSYVIFKKKKNRSGCWRLLLIETCPRKSLPSVVLNTYCFLYVFLSYYSSSLLIFMCLVFFLQLLFKVLVAGFCWDSLNHPSSLISVSCNFNSRFSFLPLLMASFRLVLVFSVLFITVISLLGLSRAGFSMFAGRVLQEWDYCIFCHGKDLGCTLNRLPGEDLCGYSLGIFFPSTAAVFDLGVTVSLISAYLLLLLSVCILPRCV